VTIFIRHFLLNAIKPRLGELMSRGLPRAAKFVVVDDSREMIWRVQNIKFSFGLLRQSRAIAMQGVQSVIVREDSCSLYASPELAKAASSGQVDHRALPVILFAQGTEVNDWITETLETAGLNPERFTYGPQFAENLIDYVLDGKGAAILMDGHVSELAAAGRLVRINLPIPNLVLNLLANANANPALLNKFVEIFRDADQRLFHL
jgi:DNA-binding transcriptional LysR family regulator